MGKAIILYYGAQAYFNMPIQDLSFYSFKNVNT